MNDKEFEVFNYQFQKNQEFFDEEHFDSFSSNQSIMRIPKPKKFRVFRESRQRKEPRRNLTM